MAKKKDDLKELKIKAGFLIVIVASALAVVTIFSGGIWFANLNLFVEYSNGSIISGNQMNAATQSVDANTIFDDHYYEVLDVISNSIAYGTTWLDLCADSQISIDDEIYIKVCSDAYSSTKDIKSSLKKYISSDLIEIYMSDYYKDYSGELYVIPFSIEKDQTYVELDSYKVISKSQNKIEYIVTSKYGNFDCVDNCKYSYKKQSFVVEKQNNNWIVTELELPY